MSDLKCHNDGVSVYGLSPLGGNAVEVEGTRSEVRLVWDSRVGAYISRLAQIELDAKEKTLNKIYASREDEEIRNAMRR